MRRVASYGELNLELLNSLHQTPGEDGSSASKRAKVESSSQLMLSMNYTIAAATINSIMEAEGKQLPASPSPSQLALPSSPSAASAETTQLEWSCSMGKRKRSV